MKLTTAGESHGKALIAIIEGLPAHLTIDIEKINEDLALRQSGFGRGARQKIEKDQAEMDKMFEMLVKPQIKNNKTNDKQDENKGYNNSDTTSLDTLIDITSEE